jgi:DNA-binding response OmpR family regulator
MNVLSVVSMTTKTILLIHKEPNIQEVIHACLTDLAGWNVRVSNSIQEGLRQAKLYQPDAIIFELSVGEIDGLLFLKQLRSQTATQKIPVLLLTLRAKWFDSQPSWFQKYQVSAVIMNPLDPAMLAFQIANELGWDLNS